MSTDHVIVWSADSLEEMIRRFEAHPEQQNPGRIGQMQGLDAGVKRTMDLVVSGRDDWKDIDQLFFPESLPAPVFGTPGLMWASLTLALLTLPVVIVSTEEGLSRIPRSIREGSLALGATQWETLWRTIIPMASPGIMTGLILAVARAAGEVAPLMLVGAVKLAPELPIDGIAPFIHPERSFMHLGFHIYDLGFQSQNSEAAKPMVFTTRMLLMGIVGALSILFYFVPKDMIWAMFTLNILISLLVGLFGGLGLAYFLEYFNDTLESVEDVERCLQLPVLGSIPEPKY